MEKHQCSVCLEEITAATSSATLACGHHFHFGCLGKWITTSGNESCPYCRHKLEEKEQILRGDSDAGSDYADEMAMLDFRDTNEREWLNSMHLSVTFVNHNPEPSRETPKLEIPPYNAEAHAFWQMRKMFELAEGGLPTVEPKEAPLHTSDKYPKYLKRKTPFGRTNWSHLGLDFKLSPVEHGYRSE